MTKSKYLVVGVVMALTSSASADQFDHSHDACTADTTLICNAIAEEMTLGSFAEQSRLNIDQIIRLNNWDANADSLIPAMHFFVFGGVRGIPDVSDGLTSGETESDALTEGIVSFSGCIDNPEVFACVFPQDSFTVQYLAEKLMEAGMTRLSPEEIIEVNGWVGVTVDDVIPGGTAVKTQ